MKVFFAEILIVAFAVVATQAGVLLETASREGFDKVEAHYLKELPNIHRDGDSLKILIAGKTQAFQNNESNGESSAHYHLVGFYDAGDGRKDYLIELGLYEGYREILINGKTGARLNLEAEPVLSLDKKDYLVASMDLDAGYAGNSLSIYRLEDFSREFTFVWPNSNPEELMKGPEKAVWVSNNRIAFVEVSRGSDLSEETRKIGWARHPMYFEKRAGKWTGPLDPDGKFETPQQQQPEDTRF